jgi:hypothetical protein
MEEQILRLALIIEDTSKKVLQFIMPLKSIYKFLFLMNKNVFLNTSEKLKQSNNHCKYIFFTF